MLDTHTCAHPHKPHTYTLYISAHVHTHTHHTQPCTGGKGDRTWTSWGKGFYPTPTRPSTTQHMCSDMLHNTCMHTCTPTHPPIRYVNHYPVITLPPPVPLPLPLPHRIRWSMRSKITLHVIAEMFGSLLCPIFRMFPVGTVHLIWDVDIRHTHDVWSA